MPLYTSYSDCKDVGNVPGRHFVMAFSALQPHSWRCQLHHKSFNAHFGRWNRQKSAGAGHESKGMFHCCHSVLCYEIPDQNRPVCWSIFFKEKPTADLPFFGTIPSDRIPKATKDGNVHFSIYSCNSCKLYQRISVTFRSHCALSLRTAMYLPFLKF